MKKLLKNNYFDIHNINNDVGKSLRNNIQTAFVKGGHFNG